MVLKYYYDLMSQPCRALYIFLKVANIPFEASPVALRKGEHLTQEFKNKLSRFQTVPFIHDDDFRLSESVGIFRYLCREYPVNDHWYPRDSKQQAKIDEYLEWQHLNTRFHCRLYVRTKWLQPIVTKIEPDPKQLTLLEDNVIQTLDKFQEFFISDSPFINSQTVSFADILAACEVEQTRICGFQPRKNRPVLKAWFNRVQAECNPYYDEAHAIVERMIQLTDQKVQGKL